MPDDPVESKTQTPEPKPTTTPAETKTQTPEPKPTTTAAGGGDCDWWSFWCDEGKGRRKKGKVREEELR